MAAIIESVLVSGAPAYFHVRDKTGQVWNGSNFVAYNSANWSTYSIALTEQTGSGYFKGDFPSAISRGKYTFIVYQGSPATLGDPIVDRGFIDWDGSDENYLDLIIAKLPAGQISDFDPISENVNLNSNQTGVTIGTVNALGTSAQNSVKTQIDTSIGSDPITELSGVPGSTPTLKQAMMFLFMALRNKRTSSSIAVNIYNGSGALIATATQSDNGTTYTKEVFS